MHSHKSLSSVYTVIECETLTQPDGGTVAITSTPGGIGKGSVANYDCNRGFYLGGESMRTCQEDGQWTGVAPICRSEHNTSMCTTHI